MKQKPPKALRELQMLFSVSVFLPDPATKNPSDT